MAESALHPWFGVDQSRVSKYLGLAAYILEDMVISPKFLTGLLDMVESIDGIIELVPHLTAGGWHVHTARQAGDKAQRKASYREKKKRYAHNV